MGPSTDQTGGARTEKNPKFSPNPLEDVPAGKGAAKRGWSFEVVLPRQRDGRSRAINTDEDQMITDKPTSSWKLRAFSRILCNKDSVG